MNIKKIKLLTLLLITLSVVGCENKAATEKAATEKAATEKAQLAAEVEKMRQAIVDLERERLEAEAKESQEREQIAAAEKETYEAILTCGMGTDDHINILACFAKSGYGAATELELKNDNVYGMYKVHNISSLGQEYRDGLHIKLSHHFFIKAQNSHNLLTLSLKVIDSKGNVQYQKSAGQYGVVSVEN